GGLDRRVGPGVDATGGARAAGATAQSCAPPPCAAPPCTAPPRAAGGRPGVAAPAAGPGHPPLRPPAGGTTPARRASRRVPPALGTGSARRVVPRRVARSVPAAPARVRRSVLVRIGLPRVGAVLVVAWLVTYTFFVAPRLATVGGDAGAAPGSTGRS